MTGTRTYSREMYSQNRQNMNSIPYSLPRSAYSTCRVTSTMQLLSKNYRYIHFAHVHKRVLFSRSDCDNQRFTHGLLMQPEQFGTSDWNVETENVVSLWVTAPKSWVQFDDETAASIYFDAQGTFKLERPSTGTLLVATCARCREGGSSWAYLREATNHVDVTKRKALILV